MERETRLPVQYERYFAVNVKLKVSRVMDEAAQASKEGMKLYDSKILRNTVSTVSHCCRPM